MCTSAVSIAAGAVAGALCGPAAGACAIAAAGAARGATTYGLKKAGGASTRGALLSAGGAALAGGITKGAQNRVPELRPGEIGKAVLRKAKGERIASVGKSGQRIRGRGGRFVRGYTPPEPIPVFRRARG